VLTLAFLIPTRDRHTCLARSLATVLPAARRVDAPVLVCDQSARPFAAQPGVQVLHRPDLPGLPAARNALLAATDADLVCFLDDDTDLAPDFATVLVRLAADEPGCAGWGPVVETRPLAVRRLHRLAHLGGFRDERRLLARRSDHPTTALFGCCFAVRRAAALAIGGFDARRDGYALGEDLDFCRRLSARGYRLRFCSALRAVHRRDGADRALPWRRGLAKGAFLVGWARRHGGPDPATPVHLGVALAAAAAGCGAEPAHPLGVLTAAARALW
jgi:hypothetical protein